MVFSWICLFALIGSYSVQVLIPFPRCEISGHEVLLDSSICFLVVELENITRISWDNIELGETHQLF